MLLSSSVRSSAALVGLAVVLLSAACGGDGGTAARPATVRTVDIAPTAVSVVQGQQATVTATPRDASGAGIAATVAWSAQDTTVVTVSASGVVTARRVGNTTVSATASGVTASATVTVLPVPVASVALTLPAATLVVGQSAQSTVATRDAGGASLSGRAITYSTANSAVATISATGVVTAVAPGTVALSATSEGVTGTTTLTVTPVPVASVTFVLNNRALVAGQSTGSFVAARDAAGNTLAGRAVAYTTSNATVATIDANGTAAAVGAGTATLTATVEGQSAAATLTVTAAPPPVATVTVVLDLPFVAVGQAAQATASTLDAGGAALINRTVAFTTSNPAVATVSSTGLTQAVGEGTATITASSEGRTGTATLTVDATAPVISQFTFSPTAIDVSNGAVSVAVSVHVTDVAAGVRSTLVGFQSPVAGSSQLFQGCLLALTSGTIYDGVWGCSIVFSPGFPGGTWTATVQVLDRVANRRDYTSADLTAAGLPSALTVRPN